jgi:hypothetical protein
MKYILLVILVASFLLVGCVNIPSSDDYSEEDIAFIPTIVLHSGNLGECPVDANLELWDVLRISKEAGLCLTKTGSWDVYYGENENWRHKPFSYKCSWVVRHSEPSYPGADYSGVEYNLVYINDKEGNFSFNRVSNVSCESKQIEYNISYCDTGREFEKNRCYRDIAFRMTDPSICENIPVGDLDKSIISLRDVCLGEVIIKTGDVSYCSMIENEKFRNGCLNKSNIR